MCLLHISSLMSLVKMSSISEVFFTYGNEVHSEKKIVLIYHYAVTMTYSFYNYSISIQLESNKQVVLK